MHIQTPHLHILTLSNTNTLNHYHLFLKKKKNFKIINHIQRLDI